MPLPDKNRSIRLIDPPPAMPPALPPPAHIDLPSGIPAGPTAMSLIAVEPPLIPDPPPSKKPLHFPAQDKPSKKPLILSPE